MDKSTKTHKSEITLYCFRYFQCHNQSQRDDPTQQHIVTEEALQCLQTGIGVGRGQIPAVFVAFLKWQVLNVNHFQSFCIPDSKSLAFFLSHSSVSLPLAPSLSASFSGDPFFSRLCYLSYVLYLPIFGQNRGADAQSGMGNKNAWNNAIKQTVKGWKFGGRRGLVECHFGVRSTVHSNSHNPINVTKNSALKKRKQRKENDIKWKKTWYDTTKKVE